MNNMSSLGSPAGSLYIGSGKEKGQDVNSSAPRSMTNDLATGSEYSMTSQPRGAISPSGAIYDQPPIRVESLLAMQRIQNARDHPESTSEDGTEDGPRKRARRERLADTHRNFHIGHHVNEPTLPVYASLGSKNNLVVQTIGNKTSQAALDNLGWLGSRASIPLEKTVLDKDLFPRSLRGINFEVLDNRQKKNLIKDFLEAKRDNQEMNVEEWILKSQEIHVGFSRQDGKIPVYCYLKRHVGGKLHPTFCIRSSDAVKSSFEFGNRLVGYKDIVYIENFVGTTFEDSKKAVQEELERLAQTNCKLGHSRVMIFISQFRSYADLNKVQASVLQSERAGTMLEQEHRAIGTTGYANEEYALGFKLQDMMTNLQARRCPVEQAAREHADSFLRILESAQSQDKKVLEARTEIKKLQQDKRDQAQEIADLKATVSRMQTQIAAHQTQPPASLQRIDIERGLFESVTSDAGSPGMLMTTKVAAKERLVELRGKKYEEYISLLECRLKYTGVPTGEIIQHNGLSFRRVMDGTEEKFIQSLEPSSLVQSEGRQFLKWVTLKEPPPPQKKTYQGI